MHKERLKHLRRMVDVMTLTATPIPRTLYLSMMGARDMSLIQTPPMERMAIETVVARDTDALVREAVATSRPVCEAGSSVANLAAIRPVPRMPQRKWREGFIVIRIARIVCAAQASAE
jgi:hypothetical protein